jgi:uncharacterized protein (TIGR02145 family)
MKTFFKNYANHFAMLLMALAMSFTFCACEEKKKPGAEQAAETEPEAAVAEETQTSDGERTDIVVATGAEFVNAIGSNRNILLKEGVYEISLNYDEQAGEFYTGMQIYNVQNMTIRGTGNKPSELISSAYEENVITFNNVNNITIENVTAGHAGGTTGCNGGVFSFSNSSGIKINKVNMYGSGVEGLVLNNVTDMEVTNSSIYECSHRIMGITESQNISFKNCLFRDNGLSSAVDINGARNVVFDGCEFRDNSAYHYNLFEGNGENILIKNTKFIDNGSRALADSGKFSFEKCTFSDNSWLENGLLTYQGQKYKTVKIGSQTWMAENMNYNDENSKCYNNDPANCAKYGRLYNWSEAKIVCHPSWHLPSSEDWNILMNYVQTDNGSTYASGDIASIAGKYLKTTSGWNDFNGKNGNGEDKYGFAALPGGYWTFDKFYVADIQGIWWSSKQSNSDSAWGKNMNYDDDRSGWYNSNKANLLSVRCVMN